MIDMTPALTEGTNNLIKWRKRYSSTEYPGKVVLNIFYRRYAMSKMWNELMNIVNKKSYNSFQEAATALERLYSITAGTKVAPYLETWIQNNPNEIVGAIRYRDFIGLIQRVQMGSKPAKEELEFSYLHYLISDKATLAWAAFCATGISPLKAITEVSGAIIQPMPLNDYNTLTVGLGQLYTTRFLQERYKPLP
ncbi:hypothetical protein [Phocaeicola sp.]|uniref:hypothetical protein n=1 Tax=Phocaeicola sp. TaxID=2773926 RepID=UPI003AB6EAB2